MENGDFPWNSSWDTVEIPSLFHIAMENGAFIDDL
jgi:hypothetical protein